MFGKRGCLLLCNLLLKKNAGIEARGFIFGPPIALAIGAKFVPMRKPNKLPGMFLCILLCFLCSQFFCVLCFFRSSWYPLLVIGEIREFRITHLVSFCQIRDGFKYDWRDTIYLD